MSNSKYLLPNYQDCLDLCNIPDSPFFERKHQVDGYNISIFNYRIAANSDFLRPYAKEMRGITFVFDTDGKIWNRFLLLEKFFNLNQTDESSYSVVRNYKIKSINEKEDGSIASFIKLPNGRVIGKTKMSFSVDQAIGINRVYEKNPSVKKLVDWTLDNDIIAVFEYVAPHNQVVVEYPKEELILLRLRCNKTGRHLCLNDYKDIIADVKIADFVNFENLDSLIEATKNLIGKEGFVVQSEDMYGNDYFFKIKSPWYLELHGLMTNDINRENKIIEFILEDKIDDILSQLTGQSQEAVERINNIQLIVNKAISDRIKSIEETYSIFQSMDCNKKEFALKYNRHTHFKDVMSMSNGAEPFDIAKKWVADSTKRLQLAQEWLVKQNMIQFN